MWKKKGKKGLGGRCGNTFPMVPLWGLRGPPPRPLGTSRGHGYVCWVHPGRTYRKPRGARARVGWTVLLGKGRGGREVNSYMRKANTNPTQAHHSLN